MTLMVAAKPPRKPVAPRTRPTPAHAAMAADTPIAHGYTGTRGWTFLTNHAHALLCLAHQESLTTRDLSLRIGITERAVQAILADLVAEGYLTKTKMGRRNSYTVNPNGRLRHPLESGHTVGELIDTLS